MLKKFLLILTVIMVVSCLFCSAAPAATAEFSGDFSMTDAKGKIATGKIFIKGDKIRQEITAEEQTSIVIIRWDKKVSWTLLPEKQYMEVALTFNNIVPQKDLEYEVTSLGKETVNGYECDVTQYTYKNKKYGVLVQWIYQKFGYPVKTQNKDAKGKTIEITEYKNIKTGNLADSLFEVPSGYQKMGLPFKMPGM
jgi:outer membrane lipoprotein-sorting protein